MARIPYFDPALAAGPRARKTYAKLPPLNIWRMAGHMGELIEGFCKLGNQLRNFTALDPVLRELIIIRVGVLCGAAYEIAQHDRIARNIGIGEDLLQGVREGPQAEVFTPLQRKVLRFTDEVVGNVRPSDEAFKPLETALGHQQLSEITVLIGYYMMVSRFLETFDVEVEETPYPRP